MKPRCYNDRDPWWRASLEICLCDSSHHLHSCMEEHIPVSLLSDKARDQGRLHPQSDVNPKADFW